MLVKDLDPRSSQIECTLSQEQGQRDKSWHQRAQTLHYIGICLHGAAIRGDVLGLRFIARHVGSQERSPNVCDGWLPDKW